MTAADLVANLPPERAAQLRRQIDGMLAACNEDQVDYLIALLLNWGCTLVALDERLNDLERRCVC